MRVFHGIAALAIVVLAAPTWAKDEPAERTVICKDGTTSKAGKGACSGHGGVDKKATKAAAKPAAPAASRKAASTAGAAAGATVICKDGTTSKAGKGACSGHGGVDKKATKAGAKAVTPTAGAAAAKAPAAPPPSAPARPARAVPAAAPAAAAQGAATAKTAAPASAKNTDPTGAIAKCKDGTYSHAKGHTGACSRHGGVTEWLDEPAK